MYIYIYIHTNIKKCINDTHINTRLSLSHAHTHAHPHNRTHTYTRTRAYTHTQTHTCTHASTHTSNVRTRRRDSPKMSLHTLGVCIYLFVCIYVFVCVYKCVYKFLFVYEDFTDDRASYTRYGVALISRIDQIRGLFYKRALQNRRYSAKEIYILREPTVRSHLISVYLRTGWRRCIAALSCCSESSKEPLISGLFCGK